MQTHRNDMLGLTLIEVLIALAIIGIALTAVIKATSQNIRGATYLQNKTIALWVGDLVMNEIRTDVLKLDEGDSMKESTTMLGQQWYWQASEEETPNKNIKKITVNVYTQEIEEAESPIINLVSYIYRPSSDSKEGTTT